MARPGEARRIRLWSASTTYTELLKLKYDFLSYPRIAFYESGCFLNEIISYKQSVMMTSAAFQDAKQTNKLIKEYREVLFPPELVKDDSPTSDNNMKNLMSELENTIVLIDKKSLKGAK